jgi:hypothetical protein
MELELTICKASDVVELVRARDADNVPFSIVISLESPGDDTEHRAPRLIKEIGPEWADRQIIAIVDPDNQAEDRSAASALCGNAHAGGTGTY